MQLDNLIKKPIHAKISSTPKATCWSYEARMVSRQRWFCHLDQWRLTFPNHSNLPQIVQATHDPNHHTLIPNSWSYQHVVWPNNTQLSPHSSIRLHNWNSWRPTQLLTACQNWPKPLQHHHPQFEFITDFPHVTNWWLRKVWQALCPNFRGRERERESKSTGYIPVTAFFMKAKSRVFSPQRKLKFHFF